MLSRAAHKYFLDQYDEKYCHELIKHCLNGQSPESFAAVINSTPEVFAYWANMYTEFEIALHIAFWKSFAWWEEQLRTNTEINPKVYKLVMAQRFKWRDDGQDLKRAVKNMSLEQLEQLASRLLENKSIPTEIIEDED